MVQARRISTARIVRLSHPLAFAAFLKQIGAPVNKYFRRHGLPTQCDDPNVFVPQKAAWSLFDAAGRAEDETVGWHVGQFVGERNLNAGLLSKFDHSPTLYHGLRDFAVLVRSEASHLRLGLHEREDDVLFYTQYPDMQGVPGYHVSQGYQIQVYLALVRHFIGPDWLPTEIGLECPDIPAGLEDRFPGTRILTNQRFGYFAIPRNFLHLPGCGVTIGDVYAEDELVMADQFDFVQTLCALLQGYLPKGYPSAELAASLMDMSVRTLSRRLAGRKLSYSAVVDEVRFKRARELLANSDMMIENVGRAVGFDDASHFARMFRRIGGLSPAQFRLPGGS